MIAQGSVFRQLVARRLDKMSHFVQFAEASPWFLRVCGASKHPKTRQKERQAEQSTTKEG